MRRPARLILPVCALIGTMSMALAAGSSTPTNYQPDPGLRTAGRGELEVRIRRACTATQAKLQSRPESALTSACGCYAARTLRAFDAAELDAYRSTGYFNDSARAKALAAVDACRLKRPA